MNEITPKLPQGLQNALTDVYAAPEPSAEFAAGLEAQLRQRMKALQRTTTIPERNSFMKLMQSRPLAALLIALIVLLLLSSAVYALGKVLGYIPGIGMVEQGSAMRTIENPVVVERDGFRLTVMNVVAGPSATSIRFQVEWLVPPASTGDMDTSCQGVPSLILPNGTQLSLIQTKDKFMTGDLGTNFGYGYVMEFAPVPADQNDVILQYPCLMPLVPGPLPRDWQASLHLVPAPDDLALPVMTAPPAASSTAPASGVAAAVDTPISAPDPTHRIAMSVDSFVVMDDGYLVIGSMQWSVNDYPSFGVNPIDFMGYINVTDANGQPVEWQEVFGNVKPQDEEFRSYWAIKIMNKNFAAPLIIKMNAVDVDVAPLVFQFDTGVAPQAGQSWDINQNIQLLDSVVHVVRATLLDSDGSLNFQVDTQVDPDIVGDIHMSTSLNQCMGGGGGYPTERLEMIPVYIPMCRPDLPPGIVEMQIGGAVLWGDWQVQWQP